MPTSHIKFTADGTLRRYYATPGNARGFCNQCGSFLFWAAEDKDTICITVGTLDKVVLKRWGPLLTDARRHLWCADRIPGVTDQLKGNQWEYDCDGEGSKLIS